MPNLRAKPEDKFSKARAAKNSPERKEAAEKKYKDTPPKSVLEANSPKKKTPRGPSSAKPTAHKEHGDRESMKTPAHKKAQREAPPYKDYLAGKKVRDEERVYLLVKTILSAWKADIGHAENTAASAGIIKVSRRQLEGALRFLKNTRFTKIPTLINDILVYNEICDEFGQWVYVEHDSPDWIFVRLPDNGTHVLRATIEWDKTGETDTSVRTSSEVLLPELDDEEEDEIPENVEYNDEDSHEDDEDEEPEEDEFADWSLEELQTFVVTQNYMGPKDAGFKDRAALIERILNKGAIK